MTIRIEYLASCPDTIPTWTDCYWHEWENIYRSTDRTREDIRNSIAERINTDRLPLAVVAFVGDTAVATGCLKVNDFAERMDLEPWVAGIYVVPEFRRQGIASAMMERLEHEAVRLGYETCFLWTASAEELYSKLGWKVLDRANYCDSPITIMSKSADKMEMTSSSKCHD